MQHAVALDTLQELLGGCTARCHAVSETTARGAGQVCSLNVEASPVNVTNFLSMRCQLAKCRGLHLPEQRTVCIDKQGLPCKRTLSSVCQTITLVTTASFSMHSVPQTQPLQQHTYSR